MRHCLEHTLLRADATEEELLRLCEEAVSHDLFGVCVNSLHVSFCRTQLAGTSVVVVSTIGFPLGAVPTSVKSTEASHAVNSGATELDMVIDLGGLKSGYFARVEADVREVVRAATGHPVKAILETAHLTDEQKRTACQIAINAGAQFVKTSTGFLAGATVHDVALLRECVGSSLGVKAAGGIRTKAQAEEMLMAGANRIGTSSALRIL